MRKIVLIALALFALTATGLPTATTSFAEETKLEVTAADALKQALMSLVNKPVTLRLASGSEIAGVLEAVGPSAVRLGSLTGKEFYSAVVSIEDISAVVYRAK